MKGRDIRTHYVRSSKEGALHIIHLIFIMAIGVVTVISHITKQIYRPRVWPKVTLHNDQRDCCEPKTQVPVPWEVCTHVYPQTPVPQQVHPCPGPQAMWQFCMHLILGPGLHSLPACQTRNQGVPQLRLPPRGTKENGKTPAAFTPRNPQKNPAVWTMSTSASEAP